MPPFARGRWQGVLSALIFVGLAAAWLIVLVPMFVRRGRRDSRTTDAALNSRVVRRGGQSRAGAGGASGSGSKEALTMPDSTAGKARSAAAREDTEATDVDDEFDAPERERWRGLDGDDARTGRRYRPGRGGFDPDAAALAARTKYARRQRVVLAMLAVAVVTAVLAGLLWPVLWWVHGLTDLLLVGYLGYLRKQVRIEEDVRNRRLARLSGESDASRGESAASADPDVPDEEFTPEMETSSESRSGRAHSDDAEVLDIDDEDPEFDELDDRLWQPYRRAVGE
nr:gephyrin-like molybdotransferase receptor GlpR [Actinopolyspora erythraea]